MGEQTYQLTDFKRWIFGDAPPEFLLEILLRTLLIYLFLIVVVRLMGKRMTGQITLTELSVVITLGAIVSPVMQMPDKAIFYGLIVLSCALIFHRSLTFLSLKYKKIEFLSQGTMSLVVKDGVIDLKILERCESQNSNYL